MENVKPESDDMFGNSVKMSPNPQKRNRKAEAPRIIRPERHQKEFMTLSLDDMIPETHPARQIWEIIEKMDFSNFENLVMSVEGGAGRSASDRKVFLALWLYALSNGINSGRKIIAMCGQGPKQGKHEGDAAYRWLAGNVPLNYHTMDSFRSKNGDRFEELLQELLATMMMNGLDVTRIANDGVKVQANASIKSFKREDKIKEALEAAKKQMEALNSEADNDADENKKKKAAQLRAARERHERCTKALKDLEEIRERKKSEKHNASASVTEGDSRIMGSSEKNFKPRYNVQIAQDLDSEIIVGAVVTQDRDDSRGLVNVMPSVVENLGKKPEIAVTDSQYANQTQMDYMKKEGIAFLASEKKEQNPLEKCHNDNVFMKSKSVLDADKKEIKCPAGNILSVTRTNRTPTSDTFTFNRKKNGCSGCGLFEQCCPDGNMKRKVSFSAPNKEYVELVNTMKELRKSPDSKALLRDRFASEHVHAQILNKFNLKKFRVRGLKCTQAELLLVVLSYNLNRWISIKRKEKAA